MTGLGNLNVYVGGAPEPVVAGMDRDIVVPVGAEHRPEGLQMDILLRDVNRHGAEPVLTHILAVPGDREGGELGFLVLHALGIARIVLILAVALKLGRQTLWDVDDIIYTHKLVFFFFLYFPVSYKKG